MTSFCTDTADAATYIFGVLADPAFGPFPPELPSTSHGKVGPDGQPLYESIGRGRDGHGARLAD